MSGAAERALGTVSRIIDELEAVLGALDRHAKLGTTPAADDVLRYVERLTMALDFAEDLRDGLNALLDELDEAQDVRDPDQFDSGDDGGTSPAS